MKLSIKIDIYKDMFEFEFSWSGYRSAVFSSRPSAASYPYAVQPQECLRSHQVESKTDFQLNTARDVTNQ